MNDVLNSPSDYARFTYTDECHVRTSNQWHLEAVPLS